jgi:hypothetical protein
MLLFPWGVDINCNRASEWFGPATYYIFAPGIFSSEHQALKYTNAYTASTGQVLRSAHGFELIQGATTLACNFAEILFPNQIWLFNGLRQRINTVALSILNKSNAYYQIEIEEAADVLNTLKPYYIALWRLNFGQELDCRLLKNTIEQMLITSKEQPLVLYGVSRGAAAFINCLGIFKQLHSVSSIKAIVLESCFDSVTRVSPWTFFLSYICPFYNPKGICPINSGIINSFVEFCNRHAIPVLVIASEHDKRVPLKNTKRVVQALKDAGLKNLCFLQLKEVTHSDYLSGNAAMAAHYQEVVHAFYKQSGVAYIPAFAECGADLLAKCKL